VHDDRFAADEQLYPILSLDYVAASGAPELPPSRLKSLVGDA
jgi:hypothetical protein